MSPSAWQQYKQELVFKVLEPLGITSLSLSEDDDEDRSKALEWILYEDTYEISHGDDDDIRNRYILALFHFATNHFADGSDNWYGHKSWKDTFRWLSPTHICQWHDPANETNSDKHRQQNHPEHRFQLPAARFHFQHG